MEILRRLAPFGIHPRQARILDALGRIGQASQVELAREFGLSAASMSTMTTRLIGLNDVPAEKNPYNVKKISSA